MKKKLRVLEKAVLLHPLSEGTRGRREGIRERSSLKV